MRAQIFAHSGQARTNTNEKQSEVYAIITNMYV